MIEVPLAIRSAHGFKQPPKLVTLDHLDSRLSPNRGKYEGLQRTVAACYECNQRRSFEAVAALSIEEKWRRSGRGPGGKPMAVGIDPGSPAGDMHVEVEAAE